MRCPRIILCIGSAIATPFACLTLQFTALKNMWSIALSGKITAHYAVDLTTEKKVTQEALKTGLLPMLTDSGEDSYIWAPKAVQESTLPEIVDDLVQKERLVDVLRERQVEIQQQKKEFQSKIADDTMTSGVRAVVKSVHDDSGILQPIEGGQGGAYLLKDKTNTPRFIVKPNDEDILGVHNRKKMASPLNSHELRVRDDIPTYTSAQNEALASDIAGLSGLRSIAPETVMVVLENEHFHLITDDMEAKYKNELVDEKGKEKLCSAQVFVSDSQDLLDSTTEMSVRGEDVRFDQADFEMANILTWITADQDGHSGNYRVYDKVDAEGRSCKGIKKIDNGLICGDGNPPSASGIVNGLSVYTEQMNQALSEDSKNVIKNLPLDKIVERMNFYHKSEESIACLRARVQLLQNMVAGNSQPTLSEVDTAIKNQYFEGRYVGEKL